MIAYLTKSYAVEVFNQIIDFLNGSLIKYALTVNPNIYVSCIKQFWTTVAVKKLSQECRWPYQILHVSLFSSIDDKKKVGDLSTHTTKYISHALTQKVFDNMRRVGKGFSGVETPLFKGMIVEQQVAEGDDNEVHDERVPAVGIVAEGVVSVDDDVVLTADEEPSIPSPTPPTPPPQLSQDVPLTSQVHLTPPKSPQVAQALEITKFKSRVKKPKKRNKASKLKRLKKVGTTQRIDTSDDTMDDVSKQGGIIANIDADEVVVLEVAKDVAIEKSADEEESEPTKLQEVVDVVTTAKIITEGMIVAQEVADEEVNVDDVLAVGVAAEGDVSAANDEVPTAVEEPSIPSPTPPTPPPHPSQDQPSTSQVYLTPSQSPQAQP
nr:hypothetical protein [Tanacetum cinerariifolium]